MNLKHLEEPPLEFGTGRHIDIRFGIMNHGPLDFNQTGAPRTIHVGVIGTTESVDGIRQWLEKCRNEIPAKPNKRDPSKPNRQPNLFARFPGFNADTGFFSTLVLDDSFCRTFLRNQLDVIGKLRDRNERIKRGVDLFAEEIRYLAQNTNAEVIICAVPLILLELMEGADDESEELADLESADGPISGETGVVATPLDFHDLLKATAMQHYRKPIQIVLPWTYDQGRLRSQTKLRWVRELQDEATRAWNLHAALYYKAGGVPWRLPRASTDLSVCYVGVSFYRSLDRQALLTSVAQVFNERGEGVIVRGENAIISKEDRQAHLPADHAQSLLRNALDVYWETHRTFPARIVMHKSSRFDSAEREGFLAAINDKRIATHDLLWINDAYAKLYRAGKYPPLRGTLLSLDEKEMVLYTRGSVPFFETYPGQYIPRPLQLHAESTDQTQEYLAQEVLALTKMNWNNSQFDGAEPVTLRASRQCSSVLRYCSPARPIEPRYSFYM